MEMDESHISSGSVSEAAMASLVQPKKIVTNIRVIDDTLPAAGVDHFPP